MCGCDLHQAKTKKGGPVKTGTVKRVNKGHRDLFKQFISSLEELAFQDNEIEEFKSVVSIVLRIGNITFEEDSSESERPALTGVGALMNVNASFNLVVLPFVLCVVSCANTL